MYYVFGAAPPKLQKYHGDYVLFFGFLGVRLRVQ
jgi:hypothetical protein